MAERRRARALPRRDLLLGRTLGASSWLRRVPAGAKVAVLALVTVVVMVVRDPLVNAGLLAVILLLCPLARVPLGALLGLLRRVWLLIAVILVLQLVVNDPWTAAEVLSRILVCLLGAQLLVLTTPAPALIAVLMVVISPLRFVGVPTGRIGLAAMVMLRSIPHLADAAMLAARCARGRGLERSVRAHTVPLLLGTVGYAQDTARALAARGLDELD